MNRSQSSAITENGNRPISPVEYFALAVQYAKERGMRSIPVPMDIATSVLEVLHPPKDPNESPPPCVVTGVTYEEEQRRTQPLRATRLPITPSERRSLHEAGRGWHQGM
jgi:hypothetical protein